MLIQKIEEGKFTSRCLNCKMILDRGKYIITKGKKILCEKYFCPHCRFEQQMPFISKRDPIIDLFITLSKEFKDKREFRPLHKMILKNSNSTKAKREEKDGNKKMEGKILAGVHKLRA
jgi:hypothetical protein